MIVEDLAIEMPRIPIEKDVADIEDDGVDFGRVGLGHIGLGHPVS